MFLRSLIISSALLSALLMTACLSTGSVPECANETNKGVLIRFGNYDNKFDNLLDGYLINDSARIQDLDSINQVSGTFIRKMDNERYCSLLSRIKEEFIKVQTLNVVADRFRYVELYNQTTRTRLRAVWDPRFDTYLSKGFREIYTELEKELSTEDE